MEINETRRNNHNKNKHTHKIPKINYPTREWKYSQQNPSAPSSKWSKYVSHFLRLFLMPRCTTGPWPCETFWSGESHRETNFLRLFSYRLPENTRPELPDPNCSHIIFKIEVVQYIVVLIYGFNWIGELNYLFRQFHKVYVLSVCQSFNNTE